VLGDTKVLLCHAGQTYDLTDGQDESKHANFMLGHSRFPPAPYMGNEPWIADDLLLLVTDGIWMYYGIDQLGNYLQTARRNMLGVNQIGEAIVKTAHDNGSSANMTVVVIKNTQRVS
jgi:serine/threonine protein phosphatase PrpC